MAKQTSSEQQDALRRLMQAEQEANEIVSQAKKRAEEIVNDAQKKADDEIKKAREEAESEAEKLRTEAKKEDQSEDNISNAFIMGDPKSLRQEAETNMDRAAEGLFQWIAFVKELK